MPRHLEVQNTGNPESHGAVYTIRKKASGLLEKVTGTQKLNTKSSQSDLVAPNPGESGNHGIVKTLRKKASKYLEKLAGNQQSNVDGNVIDLATGRFIPDPLSDAFLSRPNSASSGELYFSETGITVATGVEQQRRRPEKTVLDHRGQKYYTEAAMDRMYDDGPQLMNDAEVPTKLEGLETDAFERALVDTVNDIKL